MTAPDPGQTASARSASQALAPGGVLSGGRFAVVALLLRRASLSVSVACLAAALAMVALGLSFARPAHAEVASSGAAVVVEVCTDARLALLGVAEEGPALRADAEPTFAVDFECVDPDEDVRDAISCVASTGMGALDRSASAVGAVQLWCLAADVDTSRLIPGATLARGPPAIR